MNCERENSDWFTKFATYTPLRWTADALVYRPFVASFFFLLSVVESCPIKRYDSFVSDNRIHVMSIMRQSMDGAF